MDPTDAIRLWQLVSPEVLKENLVKASSFIVIYEMLEDLTIERTRGLFMEPDEQGRLRPDKKYKTDVKARDKDLLCASLLWLKEAGAVADSDIADITAARLHRHRLAHEMPNVIFDPRSQVDEALLIRMYDCLRKVDAWFLTEVEGAPPGSESGSVMLTRYLISLLFSTSQVH